MRIRSSAPHCLEKCCGSSTTTSRMSGSVSWRRRPNGICGPISTICRKRIRLRRKQRMCGIAGLIHRGARGNVGGEMLSMLQSLKHRGPDSTGLALYGAPESDRLVMRFKLAEQEDIRRGFSIHREIEQRRAAVDARLAELGAEVDSAESVTDYAFRYRFTFRGDLRRLADYVEDVEGAEILSLGRGLELIKDLGDAAHVGSQYD